MSAPGRAAQRLDVYDVTADLRSRSNEELQFHLDNDPWPQEGNARLTPVRPTAWKSKRVLNPRHRPERLIR